MKIVRDVYCPTGPSWYFHGPDDSLTPVRTSCPDMSYSLYPSSITNHDPTTSPHFVACGADGQVRTFGTARGLAIYMEERPLSDWALYRWRDGWRRVEIPHPAVTIEELQQTIQQT